ARLLPVAVLRRFGTCVAAGVVAGARGEGRCARHAAGERRAASLHRHFRDGRQPPGALGRAEPCRGGRVAAHRPGAGRADRQQGHWVVQSCAAVDASLSTGQGLVLRISSLGLEQFIGIPMRAMAVDDGGNVLLYSYDATTAAAEPRGLFVLSGEGRLARVDELEPSPAFIRNRGFGPTWYSATAVESR